MSDVTFTRTYECRVCGAEKNIPEHPHRTGNYEVRTGCQTCGRISMHIAVGSARWAMLKDAERRRTGGAGRE